MATPTIESVTETLCPDTGAESTDHTVNMPAAVDAGNLLLAFLSIDGVSSVTIGTPTGWTQLYAPTSSSHSLHPIGAYKFADGTEGGGTAVWTSSTVQDGAAQVYRISGQHASTPPQVAVLTFQSGLGDPDPPSLSPSWGGGDNLWIAVAHTQSSGSETAAAPTNYTDFVDTVCSGSGDPVVSSARRANAVATEDPAEFPFTDNPSTRVAVTVAIRPLASGTPGGGGGGGGGGGRGGGGGGKGPGGGGPPGQGGGPPPGQGGGPRGGVVNPGSGIGGSINRRARSF